MDNWLADGYCGENFLSIDGSVGGNRNYTWGALMCLIGVESMVDIDDHGVAKAGPGYGEAVELTNLPIHGKPHRDFAAGWKASKSRSCRSEASRLRAQSRAHPG